MRSMPSSPSAAASPMWRALLHAVRHRLRDGRPREDRDLERQLAAGAAAAAARVARAQRPPDVVALQETKLADESVPGRRARGGRLPVRAQRPEDLQRRRAFSRARRSSAVQAGMPDLRTSSGACSRPAWARPAWADQGRRSLRAQRPVGRIGEVRVQAALARALRVWLRAELALHPRMIVLGDFNIAPDDRDVHDPIGLGRVGPRQRGRSARRCAICSRLGFDDVFRRFRAATADLQLVGLSGRRVAAQPWAAHRPHPRLGRRSPGRAGPATSTASRGSPSGPSDHAPVVATFDI